MVMMMPVRMMLVIVMVMVKTARMVILMMG